MTTILHPDGSSLEVDATIGGSILVADQVTAHPIEEGSAVVDHVNRGPLVLALRVLSTETPIEGRGADSSGPDRIGQVRDFLERCRGERLSVLLDDDRFPQLDDLVLQRTAQEIRRLRDLPMDLEFVQVRVASSSTVQVPAADRQAPGFSSNADAAEQAAGGSAPPGGADDASVLVTLFGG